MTTHEHSSHTKHITNKIFISAAVAVIIALIGSFYDGMQYQKSKAGGRGAFAAGAAGRAGAMRNAMGGFATGDILSHDDTGITIKMRDGSSKIILVPASAAVLKSTSGSLGDLSVGQSVTVTGSTNADGSINAQTVQIRPAGMATPGAGR